MNIEIMRLLDYWLGVPLCFLFSIFEGVAKIVNPRKKTGNSARKILFIKLSELGAIILAHPLLKKVKDTYPDAELFFVTFEKNRGVFELSGQLVADRNILTIREDCLLSFLMDTVKTIRRLRQEGIDIVFDLDFFSRFTVLLAYLVKSGKRAGFYNYTFEGLYRGRLMTHKIQYNPLSHISRNYLSMIQAVSGDKKDSPELYEALNEKEIVFPSYSSRSEARERIRQKLKAAGIEGDGRIYLINPGEGVLPLREWPLDNFILLSRRLLEGNKDHLIIIGTSGATEKGEAILRAVNNLRCLSFAGQTSLDELAELFENSDALISNDCGLAHLAMLTSIKKFVIFGPESPAVFGPLGAGNYIIYSNWPCSPCLSVLNHRRSSCRDNKCLKAISPDDIYGLIRNSLKKENHNPGE